MKHSLLWRFVIIISIALLAGLQAWFTPPRLGIDLAGGTSLLYELDLSKLKDTNTNTADLVQQVVEVLRKRVDPLGQKNINWRVVGQKRIQIEMPYADKQTIAARTARDQAEQELRSSVLRIPEVLSAIDRQGADREAEVEKLAPKGSEQYKNIMALADANDKLKAASQEEKKYPLGQAPEELRKQKFEATAAYDEAQRKVTSSNVDMGRLQTLMAAADVPDNTAAQKQLAELPSQYPLQKAKIEKLIQAHKLYEHLNGGGVDDPAELQRLVTQAGVLDFRIAVLGTEVGAPTGPEYVAAMQSLDKYGPDRQIIANGGKARWFEVDSNAKSNFRGGNYVMSDWAGKQYILCYDDTPRSLTHSDPSRKPWSVEAGPPSNSNGEIALPFKLDNVGAKYMGALTSDNLKKPMAILLDDRAMSAPTIQSQINDSGQITFGTASLEHPASMIKKEADQLKEIMDAGSLPATLQSQPISVQNITPDMGAENISAGTHSAIVAVIAVVGFMVVYYTITGAFADLALMLNLLLVLAVMASLHGTFTLPGIAGLVLTLGMAVDANVLINERIREEIHKGASLWMAIKQGYDKVFWTIFDANLTTSLTSIVLIYVGSPEVRGFGVTLLIGLMIHMFTALFVTRTLMMAAVKWGILRAIDDHSLAEYLKEIFTFTWLRNGHFPFMRVITVSNIDWIGKRHIFWGISALITVAGLVAFVARGEDKYDIEFRGGTQVTFELKPLPKANPKDPDVYLTREQVEKRIKSLASKPGLKELDSARIYGVGNPDQHRWEMQTTIANTSQSFHTTLATEFPKKFADVLDPKDFDYTKNVITFTLKPQAGKPALTLGDVKKRIDELAAQPALAELKKATVTVVGNPADQRFQVETGETSIDETLLSPLAKAFSDVLETTPKVSFAHMDMTEKQIGDLLNMGVVRPITQKSLDQVFEGTDIHGIPVHDVASFEKGTAVVLDDLSPAQTVDQLTQRIKATRQSSDISATTPYREFEIIPVTAVTGGEGTEASPYKTEPAKQTNETRPLTRAVMVSYDSAHPYDENSETGWQARVAPSEWKIVRTSLSTESLFKGVTSFDAVVAGQAKMQAILAIVLSLVLIVIYVWVRFGGLSYGIGAILSLGHDAIVALAATVLSGVAYNYLFGRHAFLLITDFKINLTMIAAYLTIIGYSVNDTIVIFDRVRELRGKSRNPLSKQLVNDAINQCFGRTIWTTFTVFIVVLIMYIWGGEGVRGFSFAMLIGVITGAYSTLAIASPMLLTTGMGAAGPGTGGNNPFLRKDPSPEGESPMRRLKPVPDDVDGENSGEHT